MEKGDSERRAEPCKALQPTLKIGDLVLGKNGTPFKDLKQGVDMTGFAVLVEQSFPTLIMSSNEKHISHHHLVTHTRNSFL